MPRPNGSTANGIASTRRIERRRLISRRAVLGHDQPDAEEAHPRRLADQGPEGDEDRAAEEQAERAQQGEGAGREPVAVAAEEVGMIDANRPEAIERNAASSPMSMAKAASRVIRPA